MPDDKLDLYDEGITQENVMLIMWRDERGWLGVSIRNEAAERIREHVKAGKPSDVATNIVLAGLLRRKGERSVHETLITDEG